MNPLQKKDLVITVQALAKYYFRIIIKLLKDIITFESASGLKTICIYLIILGAIRATQYVPKKEIQTVKSEGKFNKILDSYPSSYIF